MRRTNVSSCLHAIATTKHQKAFKRPRRTRMEALERRSLLTVVAWDGGPTGNGTDFLDPVNWAGNALPLAADTASIGATGTSPTITIAGTPAVQTVNSSRTLQMLGGTISGGTWTLSSGASLLASTSAGTLSNVAIAGGDLLLNTTSAIVLVAGTTTFTAARLTANNAILAMAPGYTLNSPVVSEGAATGTRRIDLAYGGSGTVTFGPSAVVRLAAGSGGGLLIQNNSTATLVNNGLITAEATGQQILIQPSVFTNGTGVLRAQGGSKFVATTLNGNLNASIVDGLNSLMRLSGTYTINQPMSVTNWGTLNLLGTWTRSATIDCGGTIIFDYPTAGPTPFTSIRADIISGYNAGAWNGAGIKSTAAATTANTALGYGEASVVLGVGGGVFSGESVDATAVLVRHTYGGDVNLDRTVNVADLGVLASNWQQSPRVWTQGDFNYDNKVDVADLGILATNWQKTLPSPSSPLGVSPFSQTPRIIKQREAETEPVLISELK